MRVAGERARVLITVKATPQPSEKYGDTSCVAGLRLDAGRPSWIRLYPVAFRWLDGDSQFHKYDIIELEVRRRDADTRRESYSPTQQSWQVVENLPPWKARHSVVGDVEPTTTCQLMRAAEADTAAPSLGLVYPADVDCLEFIDHGPWSPEQLVKMQARIDSESAALIPMNGTVPALLKAPRFKVRYRYRCAASTCDGHQGRILDWELTALQNRLAGAADEEVKAAVRGKFLDQMFAAERASGFYLGNFELAARRGKFSVLGVYWPRRVDTAPTLF